MRLNKNISICIFAFPWEIDLVERQLTSLKRASLDIKNDYKFLLSVTLDLSDISISRVNWKESKLPREFFVAKFENLKKLCNWCQVDFDLNENYKTFGRLDVWTN